METQALYATAANFGCEEDEDDSSRPWAIQSVSVPVSIKRKWPSKHYVYKVAVQWSNGTSTVIYRKYSYFFDFLVKLQELVSSLAQARTIDPSSVQLPELPGKGLFGRRQTHQVAEKRRKKIEEFCQQLILLPPEISESTLVLGFFNTWPDDTMPKESEPVITAPIITSPNSSKHKPLKSTPSTQSLDTPTSPRQKSPPPVSDAIISHPDEMEHLEQYQVLANYQRKDSHQVNLFAGQVVHVIEKHDTGWWMVMTEDEQGYAPAAYLEALEESSLDRYPENTRSTSDSTIYEAMETYVADGDDEVGFRAGDRIEVITKSMDGWWKIRCNGKVGYSPAALIRRKAARPSNKTSDFVYESEKTIYEELNIHKPPPRRNTIDKSILRRVTPRVPPGYDSPRTNSALAHKQQEEQIYVEPADEDSDDENIYKVPRPITDQPKLNGAVSPYATINHTQSFESLNGSARRESTDSLGSPKLHRSQEKLSQFSPDTRKCMKDPEPVYESTESLNDDGMSSPVYENTEFGRPSTPQKSPQPDDSNVGIGDATSPTPYIVPTNNRHKPRRHTPDDYEELDDLDEANIEETNDVYEDMDGKIEGKKPTRPQPSPKSATSNQSFNSGLDDYEDMESELANRNSIAPLLPALEDYVTMDPQSPAISSPRDTAAPVVVGSKGHQKKREVPLAWRIANSSAIEGILKKRLRGSQSASALTPPVSSKRSPPPANISVSETTKPRSRFPFTKSSSMSCVEDVFEDEYVEMDSIYTMPPPDETEEDQINNDNNSSGEETPKTKPTSPSRPISSRPLPPPPYAMIETKPAPSKSQSTSNIDAPPPKPKLTRAKSVENVLSSPSTREEIRQLSPPAQQPKKSNRVPPLPPPRVPVSRQLSSPGLDSVDGASMSHGENGSKPVLERLRSSNNKSGKPLYKGQQHTNREGSPENPCDLPPVQKPRSVGTPGREFSPTKRSISPPNLVPPSEREGSPHRALVHTVSEPQINPQRSETKSGVNFPKTYIAKISYTSQTEGCLSFSAGDKCVLVSQTRDGWWLVNIGGREGWTPGDYWEEDVRNRATIASRPPTFAPKKLPEVRKPRSHTVATDTSIPQPPPTVQRPPVDAPHQEHLTNSLQLSSNTEREKTKALSSSMELLSSKTPLKPPPYSKTGKGKNPPPPKPRPLQNTGSSPGIKRKPPVPQKPVLPQKPSNAKISPRVSPTPPVGQPPANATPSPPPPLPPANLTRKRGGSHDGGQFNHDTAGVVSSVSPMVDGEYVMLQDAVTKSIENAPWFAGKMDRGQAEQFLMEHGRQREFLVRERTAKEGFYALSIRHHYSCKHFNIDPTHDHQYSMGTLMFPTIDDIIRHYQQNSLFIHDGQHVTLGQPVKRRVRHAADTPKSNANVFS